MYINELNQSNFLSFIEYMYILEGNKNRWCVFFERVGLFVLFVCCCFFCLFFVFVFWGDGSGCLVVVFVLFF